MHKFTEIMLHGKKLNVLLNLHHLQIFLCIRFAFLCAWIIAIADCAKLGYTSRCDKLSPSIITIAGEDSIRSCKNPNYPVLSRQMAAPDRTNSVTATKNSRHAACMLVVFPGFGTNLTWRFSFATFGAEINYRSQFCGLQLVANLNGERNMWD